MGRKTGSYKFEKRRRELEKKKKKAAKRDRKFNKDGDTEESREPEPSIPEGLLAGLSANLPDES